jgi:hypothetical protein
VRRGITVQRMRQQNELQFEGVVNQIKGNLKPNHVLLWVNANIHKTQNIHYTFQATSTPILTPFCSLEIVLNFELFVEQNSYYINHKKKVVCEDLIQHGVRVRIGFDSSPIRARFESDLNQI